MKIRLQIYFLLAVFSVTTYIYTQTPLDSDDFDNIDVENIIEDVVNDKATDCTPQSLLIDLVAFLEPINLNTLLKANLYLRTNTVNQRSLHDLPMFEWYCSDYCGLSLRATPFYNQTSSMYFTHDSSKIGSYINLTQKDIIEEITPLTKMLDISISEILPLFTPIRLQERRIGGMFQLCHDDVNWIFQLAVPLYYLERNFFLSNSEIEAIKSAPYIQQQAAGSGEEETRELMTQTLVSDRFGFGDIRLSLLYNVYTSDIQNLALGAQTTIPSAITLKNGIIGAQHSLSNKVPPFDFEQLLRYAFCGQTLTNAQKINIRAETYDYLLATLDRLTATVGNSSLGTGGHWIFAPLYQHDYNPIKSLRLQSKGTVQFSTPKTHLRCFVKKVDPNEYNRNYLDASQTAANYAFINQRVHDIFFPEVIRTQVTPGILVEFNEALTYMHKWFEITFGYDFWWKGTEKLKLLCADCSDVEFAQGIMPSAYAQKFFGNFMVNFDHISHELKMGFSWDATFNSKGIGKDFTLALDFRWLF